MKKINLIEWLWKTDSHEKQSPQRFGRYAVMLFLLLTIGVGQMWASEPHFSYVTGGSTTDISHALVAPANDSYDEYCIYLWVEKNTYFQFNTQKNNGGTPGIYRPDKNNDREIKSSTGAGQGTYDGSKSWKYTGNTGLTKINAAQSSNREWNPYVWIDSENLETAILQGSKIMFYFGSSYSSTWLYLKTHSGNPNSANQQYYVLDDVTKSGTTTHYTVAYASAGDYYISNRGTWGGHQFNSTKAASAGALLSLGDTDYKYDGVLPVFSSNTYKHATGVAVSSISATASNSVVGHSQTIHYYYTTSSTPGSASFTKFDPSDISDLSAGTYYLYALGWDGHILVRSNVATLTVADAPGISLSIEDGSSNTISAARSGDVITLVASPVNAGVSPTIKYEVSTSSTFASDITTIAIVASNTQTWTVPASTSNVNYYFRASVTSSGYECTSSISSAFTGYGKKTIHVRNNKDWNSFKIHHWGTNDINPTSWESLPSCPNEGGQWYTVVIYNCAEAFVLTNGGGYNQDKTIDLAYSGQASPAVTFTDGGYYEMSTNGSDKQTLSSSSAPATPGATTNEATVSSATSVVFNYSVNANRDKATPGVAFKQSDSNIADAATLYSEGTKVNGSAVNGNASGSTSAQTITAGKDWYYVAYGTNSVGTGYGSIRKIRTTAVTLDRQGGTTGSTSVVAVGGKAMPSATMPTRAGYDFAGYYTNAGGSGTKYYNVNGSSANNWPTDQGASVTLHADWTALQYDVTLKLNGGTGTEDQVVEATSGAAMPTTIKTAGTAIVIPTKTGYNFNGYWDATSGGTQYYTYTGSPAVLASARSFDKAAATTLYAQWVAKTYTVTLDHKGGTSGPSNPTVTYDAKPTDLASLPTRTGYGFDGYWTQDGSSTGDYGIQVIDGTGKWLSSVAYNTDASGNWIHDSEQTYYAKWLAVGYYVVGGPGLDNWVTKPSKLFSGSPLTLELALNKSSFEDNDPTLTALFKIRQVKEGASSTDVWFGKGANDGDVSFGKYNPTEEDLNTSGSNMQLEVYYNGTYTFKISNIDATPNLDLTVEVPVIDQLQIYSGCDGTVDAYYNWDGAPVGNVVSKTVTLDNCSDPNGFYFKAVFDSEYYGKTGAVLTRASSSATDLSTSGGNIKIKTDVKGDYTFKFNTSTHALNVIYPEKHQINYSAVTLDDGTGESASPTATNDGDGDEAVANGGYVAKGYSVTFHAAAANTGYTFRGWFSKNNPSNWTDGLLEDDADYTATIDDATTVYAVYSEDDFTVTVGASATGGSITTPTAPTTTVTAHPATGTTIVAARTNNAWHFAGWTVESGTAAFGDASALSTTVTATTDATIKANFVPRFGLVGSIDDKDDTSGGMPGWNDATSADFTVEGYTTPGGGDADITVDLQCARTLNPNTRYKFRVYDRDKNTRRACTSDDVLPAEGVNNWKLDGTTNDVHIQTVGRGTYTFHITKLSNDAENYPSLQVERQASWQVSIGQGFADIDGIITSNSSTGGTMAAEATESGTKVGITNGLFIANGGKLDFEATPATGYSFEGWYSASNYPGVPFATANPSEIASVTAAANVYAKFVENSTAVTIEHNAHGHVTVDGETATSTTVGIATTRALVAVPDAGYYFAGWTVPVGADFELQDKSEIEDAEVTLHGLGAGTAGRMIANFVEEDKIFFRNIDQSTGNKLWDNDHIYVYFGTTWKDGKGVQTISNYKEMSPYDGTKNYWAYVPHSFTKSGGTAIAFSDVDMHTNDEFYGNKGVYRTDYSRLTNMFVPNRTTSGTTNGTVYHSNGYWKVFDPKVGVGQGYYLQLHTGESEGVGSYEQKGEFTAVANGSSKISYTMRVDNTSTQTTYRIVSAGGVHYTASSTITSAAYENVTVNEYKNCTNCYFTVTPTSEGDYTFVIDQSEDFMKLTVNYPVSVGDYRLKHSYVGGKKISDPEADSTYYTYSNVIKSSDASTPRTLSMYLNTTGEETLVLQKCTAIVAGVPSWDAGDATNLSGVLTTVGSNPGVYQFDVAVSGDHVAEAPTATKYTGSYYIKTDGAAGGWANFTQNGMTENTLNYDVAHPEKSFNYYYCKYYNAAGANLKCVIANEYCNALTDTLIGDAVIGMGNQTTPSAVSVRFSYNSYTNEIKRSYLGASTTDDFLRVLGNTTASAKHIYDKDETTYDDSHADSYIKFEDKQNWRYEIDVYADVNARAKLTASFNGQTQYFMGQAGETGHEWDDENTEQLFGGASGTYALTLVYDFKTNKLIRAWKPTGSTISENLTLESDVLLLREHQGAPAAITFGKIRETEYASLTEVKTVYSVLRLNRWRLSNRAHPEDVNTEHCNDGESDYNEWHEQLYSGNAGYLSQHERELYFISFPYDVKMSDIISFGDYYDTWGIMYYDGKKRAKYGYWIDSDPNWTYFTPAEYATETLNAYEGYLIGIDLATMRYDNTSFWTNNSSEVDIYFPSKEPVSTITQKSVTVNIDQEGYQCTINRPYGGNDGDRRVKDSYWHCIGVPSYADLSHAIHGEPGLEDVEWSNKNLLYLYEWNTASNDHTIQDAKDYNFQAMYAYLVQYAGTTLSWSAAATGPASIAAKRMKTEELRDRQFNLQLLQGAKVADHTYIRLSDDEEVTTGFEFNHDVSKMMLNGSSIYTLIGYEQAAANSLPLNMEQTTVVPVGVKTVAEGEYTFSIPEGTYGVGITLIDNETGARTNLGLTDYTVNLNAGTYDARFVLEISPIQHTPTGVEAVSDQSSVVRKVLIDGILYIVKEGVIYDARGNRVQ